MKPFRWNTNKNEWLKQQRNISFEQVKKIVKEGKIITIEKHRNPKYKHQRIFIIMFNDYVYCVPYIEEKEYIFLKTIYPDRKQTKKYLKNKKI